MPATGFVASFLTGFTPKPRVSVSTWADANRVLPRLSSKESGRYRTDRTPYMKEIMDAMSVDSDVNFVVIQKGTQIGGSESANNATGYWIEVAPAPIMYVLPTIQLAEDYSKRCLLPMIRSTPSLNSLVKETRVKDGSTIMMKMFPGGILYMSGANSASSFRNKSICYLVLDDVDGYPQDVDKEGNPVALAIRRTDTYGTSKKVLVISTPTERGISTIENFFLQTDRRHFHVPCPFCGFKQVWVWERFKMIIENNVLKDIYYICAGCNKRIDEHHKHTILSQGEWIPEVPEIKNMRGYHLPGFYSPLGFLSWRQIGEERLAAGRNPELLKVWMNTRLAETYEMTGEQTEWRILRDRAEPYDANAVPADVLFLAAGIDVQMNRLAVVVLGFAAKEEIYVLDFQEIIGETSLDLVWEKLDGFLSKTYNHPDGELSIHCCAIDTGGHDTPRVYHYCRHRYPFVFAVKGAPTHGKPIVNRPNHVDVTYKGQTESKALMLFSIGTDTAKTMLYTRLKLTEKGESYIHFSNILTDDFYQQLTSEKLVTRMVKGFPRREWFLPRGARNEALDCFVYAYAAATIGGLQRIDFKTLKDEAFKYKPMKPRDTMEVYVGERKPVPIQKKVARSRFIY